MGYKYSMESYDNQTMARACRSNASVSLKKTVELSKAIKGKKVSSAINYLERVAEQKAVVPYTRYKAEVAHKRGVGIDTGGYPVKVAKEVLSLLKSAQKNASEKEISGDLYVLSVSGRKGSGRYHIGRHMGRKMKTTNLEVIVGVKDKKGGKKEE